MSPVQEEIPLVPETQFGFDGLDIVRPVEDKIDFLEILEDEQYSTLKNDNIALTGPGVWTLTCNIIIIYQ